MKRQPTIRCARLHRQGFTLVELIVVILIIAILIALILPAIQGVRRNVQQAAVATEITQLDQAIASFKTRFGVEPPSSLTIPRDPAGSGTGPTTWTVEDRQKILRVWDQFDFATLGGMGYPVDAIYLNGAECLVFFLGGLNGGSTTAPQLVGFSKNPRTPWSTAGENRDAPFFDGFDSDRLVDVDGDGALEFLDSLPDQTMPYLYLSSQGKSYRKVNDATKWDDYDVAGGMTNAADLSQLYVGADGKTPERATGYQIISPGFDGTYGVGGVWTDGSELTGTRAAEADNITNFAGGRLHK